MSDNQTTFAVLFGIMMVFATVSLVRGWRASARLAGMREAVTDLSRTCSHHYEEKGEDLPQKVIEALDYMKRALAQKDVHTRCRLYLTGAAMLGDAMGLAAWHKGFEAGQELMDARDGETRIDLKRQEILDIAYMAHLGFEQMISDPEGFKDEDDAERASSAIRKIERHKPADTVDESDPYAMAFNRSTMIWQRWPNEQGANPRP
ncbi:hypothetical protein [Bradyrhizobium arachidis]|uniref:Uncharacterized protein n=1 Tax=Bradyrhizobium arachidis TaxID=858423 RepID=A0AAE7NLB7_9BRAD|nr:hypothetical protein [Bradyrhizobium arachidis]QOZ66406.1 hypothetical protein WN72_08315 [Bradyrhizobium arachidis]